MMVDPARLASFVMDCSIRAIGAAAAVALVLRVLRVRAAATRHAAWSAVLVAMLSMPVLPSVVPPLPLPVRGPAVRLLVPVPPPEEDAVVAATPPAEAAARVAGAQEVVGAVGLRERPRAVGEAASSSWLLLLLVGTYAAVAVFLLARLLHGWSVAAGMGRRARRRGALDTDAGEPVYPSPEVVVPMTVGVIDPVIVVPAAWPAWDAETRRAIAAHEAAHVRRRDPVIRLLAALNRAVFWFHPLSWWLEHTIAVTAEYACDEAALRAIGAPDRYAGVVLNMADIVRRHRGRVAWQGIGVNGGGVLHRRIERMLASDACAPASRRQRVGAAVGCVLAIAAVVACRQQDAASPLRADPAVAKRFADQEEQTRQFRAARDMTQEQADALEQRLAANPQDFDIRQQLVTYYTASGKVAWDRKVAGLRRHALWLIEHAPEHDVRPPALSPEYDPQGFAAAARLWEAHLARPDVSPFLVYRAAMFFAPHDKSYAERLILRGMAMDPDSTALAARMPPGVGAYEWPVQLSSLYAAAVRGSESSWGTYNDLRTHPDRLHTPFANEVRRKLEETTDAALLARVGSILASRVQSSADPELSAAMGEIRALGVRYLERALELKPDLVQAKAVLVRLRLRDEMTDAGRLANRALDRYTVAEDITEWARKDAALGRQQREEAARLAEDALKLADAHTGDPAYSAAVMTAHQVLALHALRENDRERAVEHLMASVKVPASDEIRYATPFAWSRPMNRLLQAGERERMVAFLDALADLSVITRDGLRRDAQAIREGRMPFAYQSMFARG